ncbi:FAD-dependent oxidoreductase [Proteobacteria bacterium 005FR1]|nr:FAD-dependent oxidoreductase [Proteobacteria bacterium 005FR1]
MSAVWNLAGPAPATFPRLEGSTDVDVAIIGGGLTGLATALILCDAGERVAVIESHTVGSGSSGGSTGNLYSTVSNGLAGIRKKWDQDTVNKVVALRRQALDDIQRNVERLAGHCHFERRPLHFCIQSNVDHYGKTLEEEYEVSVAAGLQAEIVDRPHGLGMSLRRVLRIENQAQYNPLEYCYGLAKAVQHEGGLIFEHSPVAEVDAAEGKVTTADGAVVRAGQVVFATHTPKGISMLQAEMEVYREHGIAAPLNSTDGEFPRGIFWTLDGFHSVRSYEHEGQPYIVVVGQKHETGHGDLGEGHFEELGEFARSHFDVAAVSHRWSAQQYQSADLLPYVGRSAHDNVYVATGYSADGLVWSEVAAQVISHQILGRKDIDGGLLNPRRFTPGKSAKAWLEANTKVAKHLSTDRFTVEKMDDLHRVEAGEGKVLKIGGDSYAVYRSPEGELKTLSPICPHMKCMVHWNSADKSWDCPCHGSRFDVEGEVLEGPAYKPLEKRSPKL